MKKKIILIILCCILCSCEKATRSDEISSGQEICQTIIDRIENYRDEYGRYPVSLDKLIPEFLNEAPTTITDQEFGYTLNNDSDYYLYFRVLTDVKDTLVLMCTYIKSLDFWDCSLSIAE